MQKKPEKPKQPETYVSLLGGISTRTVQVAMCAWTPRPIHTSVA